MLSRKQIKTWHWVHKWTSLVCTVFLLMLCVTGLPLIFYHEIDHALGYTVEPAEMAPDTPHLSVDTLVDKARDMRSQDVVQFIATEAGEPELWYVGMGETADAPMLTAFYAFDSRSGELLYDYPLNQGVMNFMFRLHYDMFAGLPGSLFLGAMGLLLVVSLISGVVVYGPFMRKLSFGTVRKDKSRRIRWLDLHNLLGIATLMWLLVVSVTGVINTLAIPIYGYWKSTELAEMVAPYQGRQPLADKGSAQQALDAAQAIAPGQELSFMSFPGNDFASEHHYAAYMRGQSPLTSRLFKPILIDAQNYEITDTRDLPWYVAALLVSQPLHFGDYGGMPLKILWALLDILAIVVLGSGLYLWFKKRKVPFEARLDALRREQNGESLPLGAARSGKSA